MQGKFFSSFLFSLFFLLFSLSCASNPAFSIVPLNIPEDIAGIVHAGHTNSPEEYSLLDRMGANWVLTTFYWGRIEPSDDQWNFEWYDTYVDTAKAAGKKVLGVLGYDVRWIHDDDKTHGYIPPDKLVFFNDYVQQTAAHFRGRVDAWCIWNEPNFHFWKGTRHEFFELFRQATDALREADPYVILLGGAFNRGVFGLPRAYIRDLFESSVIENIDAVAFHPYELNPARTARLYGKFHAISADYGYADRIWVTEVGYPTGGWYPTAVTEKKFPAFVVKTFVNLAISGARTIFWYHLFDPENRSKGNSEDFFGLVRSSSNYTSKGAEAFRLCAEHLAGTAYYPDKPLRENLPSSLKAFYFETPSPDGLPSGGGVLVLWKNGSSMRVALDIPGSGHAMHDPVSGNAVAIQANTVVKVGSMPVFITWNASGDSQTRPVRLSRGRKGTEG